MRTVRVGFIVLLALLALGGAIAGSRHKERESLARLPLGRPCASDGDCLPPAECTPHQKFDHTLGPPADWFAFFAEQGWTAGATKYLPEEGLRVGRPMPLPWPARLTAALSRVLNRARHQAFLKNSAYVLLERSLNPPSRLPSQPL